MSSEDRISELPEALLLKILSLLPTKNVVAMSVLSKLWRSLWKMVPNLEFDSYATKDLERFLNNVSRCLLSHRAPVLQSLHLELYFGNDVNMDIGILLGIAFGRQLRKLVLKVSSVKSLRFPTSLYNCETLETLKLYRCVLVDVPFPVCLKSLRTLKLYQVVYKDDKSVLNLFSGCLSLENLVIHQITSFDVKTFTIAVPSLQRLTLTVEYEDEAFPVYLIINTPSLKYLKIDGILDHVSCLIENMPELVEASITYVSGIVFENIIGSLTSVKRLSLEITSSPSESEIKFPTGINIIFNQLVSLELHTHEVDWWNLLTLMLLSSPNLKVLKIIGDLYREPVDWSYSKWNQPKNVPECVLLHLETFVWINYIGEIEDEKEVAKYILRNASCLKKATFSNRVIRPEERLERLVELESVVMASNSCQLLFN